MQQHYLVRLTGVPQLPAAQRIALETRYARALEALLGSAETITGLLLAAALQTDAEADGQHVPGKVTVGAQHIDDALSKAEVTVWAEVGEIPGAYFHVSARG